MRFMDYSMDLGEPIDQTMTERVTENIVPILRGLFALIIVGLVLILAVRPALRKLADPQQLPAPEENTSIQSDDAAATVPALPDGSAPRTGREISAHTSGWVPADPDFLPHDSDEDLPEYVTKQGIRGSLRRKKIDHIQHLADEKPEEVLRVLRSWLLSEADA